eukprot:TRINITY_DN29975_c0_g1_i1.p1 TRINITY_DN29975_c0_g1~~TRINITY_DN29975_c0_g1_i1.p1  ORF type:complete len:711 (+),score=92.95 TRINITY_DN29975_c0_g1_i1:54-2186(+)
MHAGKVHVHYVVAAAWLLWGMAIESGTQAVMLTVVKPVTSPTSVRQDQPQIEKPELNLVFKATYSTSEGSDMTINADLSRLALSCTDGLPTYQASRHMAIPRDASILDFQAGRRYEHARFFEEVVCYEFDLDLGFDVNDTSREKAEKREDRFKRELGDLLGVPLELYSEAHTMQGAEQIAGQTCRRWSGGFEVQLSAASLDSVPESVLATLSSDSMDRLQAAAEAADDACGTTTFATNVSFCVSKGGLLLATWIQRVVLFVASGDMNPNASNANASECGDVVPGFERQTLLMNQTARTEVVSDMSTSLDSNTFDALRNVSGTTCIDLRSGHAGSMELDSDVNGNARIARINREAAGVWQAATYSLWEGVAVRDVLSSLGTQFAPTKLPLKGEAKPAHRYERTRKGGATFGSTVGSTSRLGALMRAATAMETETQLPVSFDARREWPECASIWMIRNQGRCGSCWAFAAAAVLADRLCIAGKLLGGDRSFPINAYLSPGHMVDCAASYGDLHGCGGGRLDDAWYFLREFGTTSEFCSPYKYCPQGEEQLCGAVNGSMPSQTDSASAEQCSGRCPTGEARRLYRATMAYAVSLPGDTLAMQRELMLHGPVQVAMFIFSDFHSYKDGVYFRTPSSYGPLGGHAVRIIGWGNQTANDSNADYWLIANSWSPYWGLDGFLKMRRGTNECGIETMPTAGVPEVTAEMLLEKPSASR